MKRRKSPLFKKRFKLRSSRSASNRPLRATVGQNSSSVQMACVPRGRCCFGTRGPQPPIGLCSRWTKLMSFLSFRVNQRSFQRRRRRRTTTTATTTTTTNKPFLIPRQQNLAVKKIQREKNDVLYTLMQRFEISRPRIRNLQKRIEMLRIRILIQTRFHLVKWLRNLDIAKTGKGIWKIAIIYGA